MSDLPTPAASRLPRARWLDARLLVGLLMVLLSVVVGAKLFADVDERVQVWSVTRDLGADTVLTEDEVAVAAVRLDAVAGRYVAATEDLSGLMLTRPVGRGELLPLSAVASADAPDRRRVVVEVDRVGVAGLTKGSVVDLYAVLEDAGEDTAPPTLVLSAVTVAEDVRTGGGAFGGSGSRAGVTLLVDAADVPAVIEAMAHGEVYVVQVTS